METMPYIPKLQTEIPCLVLYEVVNKSKATLCTAFGILLYDIFPVFSSFINIKPCVHFGIDCYQNDDTLGIKNGKLTHADPLISIFHEYLNMNCSI